MLSGLPRTGSTLLSGILNQNPKIHSEGNSGLLPIIDSLDRVCFNNIKEQLEATRRIFKTPFDLVSTAIEAYYKDVKKPIIIDKSTQWTKNYGIDLIYKYITDKPKIIVLRRRVEDVIKSFLRVYKNNNRKESAYDLLKNTNQIIYESIWGITEALQSTRGEFLFINYDDFIDSPNQTLKTIYDFCEWKYFPHDLNNIIHEFPEDDTTYELNGLHHIRPTITKLRNQIELPNDVLSLCNNLNKLIGYN